MINSDVKIHLAIFASGGGSNAQKILQYFQGHPGIQISLILYNRKDARVSIYGSQYDVPAIYWSNKSMSDENETLAMLSYYNIDGIILAGYLALLPGYLIKSFPDRIINIHPALLPQYGGKGMYGNHVHEAVSADGRDVTGITIHLVNEEYDKGKILFQHQVEITPHAPPAEIQQKVLAAEHQYFSKVIDQYFSDLIY